MAYFNEETSNWEWYDLNPLELTQFHPASGFLFDNVLAQYSPMHTALDESSEYAPTSVDTPADSFEELQQIPSRKRQQSSESCQSDALVRPKKTRRLRSPPETAKVREKGACFHCQKKRKECKCGPDLDGPCEGCLKLADKIEIIPGLVRPLCWRPNIGGVENFRRGPTTEFAFSQRGTIEDGGLEKQAIRKHFAVRRSGKGISKIIQLCQNPRDCGNTLSIKLDRYQPLSTDKQYYTWYDNGVEQKYVTPAYGISQLDLASSAIDRFLRKNFDAYVEAQMKHANEITRKSFETAQQHKHLPLVERALKLWVACRFIEEPWSIVGTETLGLTIDPNVTCPFHDRIPVPPIVDLQIDLIVVNDILQPELKKILKMLKTMLEGSDPWTDWFEIYLAYFILLHNVELTLAHDAQFVKRNNLKTKYSNKPLVNTIMNGANTLLTCFHYAHQGYAPFVNLELEQTEQWSKEQLNYLEDVRPLLNGVGGDFVQDASKDMFWTSQLHKPDWRPVVLFC